MSCYPSISSLDCKSSMKFLASFLVLSDRNKWSPSFEGFNLVVNPRLWRILIIFFWHLFRRRLIAAPVGDCWICQCWNKFMNQCTMKRNWFLFLNETTWMNTIWLSIAISQYILPQLLNLMGMFPLLVPFVLSWRSGHVRCLMHSLSYPNWHIAGVLIYALMGGGYPAS